MSEENTPDTISEPPWKAFSAEELELEYSPSRWVKRCSPEEVLVEHIRVALKDSQAAKAATHHRCDIRYADGPKTMLDVYGEDLPSDSPILVFLHGGYWQWRDGGRHLSASMVQPLHHQGILTVVVGYDIAPQVGVDDIVVECGAAVRWACGLARKRGSRGVVLAGWSAGAQLITQVVSEACGSDGVESNLAVLRGLIAFSGIFDLRPLVHTSTNNPLKLTAESAWQLSPLRTAELLAKRWGPLEMKLLAVVGEHEPNEFKRQARQYYKVCVDGGMEGEVVEVEGTDHFSIIENLSNSDLFLTRKIGHFIHACTKDKHEEKQAAKVSSGSV